MAQAQALARDHKTRESMAVAFTALATLEEHRGAPRDVAAASLFLAEQHLQLGEEDRARRYFQRAADLGFSDPRLATLPKPKKSGVTLTVTHYTEQRLDGSPAEDAGWDKKTHLPALQGPPDKPSRSPRPTEKKTSSRPGRRHPRPFLPKLPRGPAGIDRTRRCQGLACRGYQGAPGNTLPSYNRSNGNDTLPSYNTDTKKPLGLLTFKFL